MKRIIGLLILLFLMLTTFILSFILLYQSNKTYTISYFSSDEKNDSINLVYNSNDEIHLIVNPYKKEGYRFKGWNINGKLYNEYASFIVPNNDVNIIAEWVKIINVTLETNNNQTVTSLNIDQGSTLDYSDLPLPEKQGSIFEDWYLDTDLSVRYNAGVYKFNTDTSLFAKYTSIIDNSKINHSSSSKVLINQDTNFNINIYSDIELTNDNINSYVNFSSFNVDQIFNYDIDKIENKKYKLTILNELNEGANYIFNSLNDKVYFLVKEDNSNISTIYNSLFISTTNPNKSVQIIKNNVLELTNNDYYYFSDNELFLKEEYVFNNEINNNTIVKIVNNQSVKYAKIKNIEIRTINSNVNSKNVCVAILDSVLFTDIFENLQIAQTKELNLNNYLNKNTISEVKEEFTKSKEYNVLQNMYVDTVKKYLENKSKDYNLSFNEISEVSIDHSKTKINVYLTNKGFEINSSFNVVLNSNIYFEIKILINEEISTSLFSNLNIDNELINFDIYTQIDTKTNIEMDVIFHNKEEVINVKDDLNSLISNLNKNEFYEKYNEYLNYNTGKLNLLNLNLVNIDTNINEFIKVKIPINIQIDLGINSPLFSKFTLNSSKIYGLKTNNNVLESYTFDNGSTQSFEASYNGHFNLEKGINFGFDVSFIGFENFGNFGANIYNGYNFDIYGSSTLESFGNKINSSSGYYFEIIEKYNDNVYFNNPTLNTFNEKNNTINTLHTTSGNEYMVFDFVNKTKEIKSIELINGQANLNDYNLFTLEELNLKTGKLENITEDRNTFDIITSSYFNYDKESGILSIKDAFKDNDIHGSLIIRYVGNVYNNSKYIDLLIEIHYEHDNYYSDNTETENKVKVTYMIEDEIYFEELVPYNSNHYQHIVVSSDYYKSHPNYEYIYWNTLEVLNTPLTKDTIFKATIVYKKINVTYEYEILDGSTLKTIQERVVAVCGVDKVKDLTNKLVYFEENITDKCSFIKWENHDEIINYKENQVFKATYNKQNLDVILEISEVIVNGIVLLDKQLITVNIPFGTIPEFNYKSLSGFKLIFDEYNNEPLYKNTLIKANLIREKDYSIKFYDYYGNILYETNAYLGENLYILLSHKEIANYKYPVSISSNKQATLKAWTNSEKLKFINSNIELYPLFEITNITQKIMFNLSGAHFNTYYEYIEKNGLIVNKGSKIDSEILENIIPYKEKTEQYEYQFDGWYYGNTKVDLSTYEVTRDTTFTARFKEVERLYSIEILSNGFDSYIDGGINYEKEISGIFSNNETKILGDDLSYNDIRKVFSSISNLQKDTYIPISLNEDYIFERYIILYADNKYTIVPLYKNNQYNATVIYNNVINTNINNYESAYHINLNNQEEITFDSLNNYNILNNITVKYLNPLTNVIEDTMCSYKNDNYFYVFTGWSLDKENILNNDSIIEYNEVINLYAIYKEYPMIKQATFSVENEDEKILVNGIEVENNYLVNLTYKDSLPTDITIEAIKEVTLENIHYTYQFIGWYCIESDSIVLNNFNDNYHYVAKFIKVISK